MFHWDSDPLRLRRTISRRDSLRVGMLGLGGLALPDLLRLRSKSAIAGPQGAVASKETSVILLFVHGGPSQLETYDLKPEAPTEIRGPFLPITTAVPGIDICEHLPKQAKLANKFTLIRSCCHDQANHFEGHARFLSGYGQFKPGSSESYYPQVGAVVNRVLTEQRGGLAAVAINGVVLNGPDYSPGIAQGFWSSQYRVPISNFALRDASLTVESHRLGDRLAMLKSFDRYQREADATGAMAGLDVFNQRAINILTTNRVRDAFDLTKEDPRLCDKYGDGYGREVLVARRLVEAGVGFVSVRIPGSGEGTKAYDWDDHAVNWDMLGAMNARLPKYDHVVSTLIQDIYDRGLDQNVLIVVTGEFGRTPRLEFKDGKIGRDHHPGAMSILVSGGGKPMGQVIGATDHHAARPSQRPLDPHDILATIYQHLGIDHKAEFPDPRGRPIPLTRGTPIMELA